LGFSVFVLDFEYQSIFEWWPIIVIALFPLALKLAAPRIPFGQVITCSFIVLVLNYLSCIMLSGGSFVLWWLLGKSIQVICVLVFGVYWSYCNYIPAWANKW
jgi:hypothetical protein